MPRSRQGSWSSRQQRRESIRGTTQHEGNDTKEKPASNSVLYTLLSLPRDNDAPNKALMRLAPQPLSTLIFLRNVLKYRRVQAQHVASPPGGGQRGDAPGASTEARGHHHPQRTTVRRLHSRLQPRGVGIENVLPVAPPKAIIGLFLEYGAVYGTAHLHLAALAGVKIGAK